METNKCFIFSILSISIIARNIPRELFVRSDCWLLNPVLRNLFAREDPFVTLFQTFLWQQLQEQTCREQWLSSHGGWCRKRTRRRRSITLPFCFFRVHLWRNLHAQSEVSQHDSDSPCQIIQSCVHSSHSGTLSVIGLPWQNLRKI